MAVNFLRLAQVWAIEPPPHPLCGTFLELVRTKTLNARPQALEQRYGKINAAAGLPTQVQGLFTKLAQVEAVLANPVETGRLNPYQLELLQRLRPSNFANQQVYLLNSLGISQWTRSDYEAWVAAGRRLLSEHPLIGNARSLPSLLIQQTNLAQTILTKLMTDVGPVPGLNDQWLRDWRAAYRSAVAVRDLVLDPDRQEQVTQAQDALGNLGYAKQDLPTLFQTFYEIERIRGLENMGGRVPEGRDLSVTRLRLPVHLEEPRHELVFGPASARYALEGALRYSMAARLIRIDADGTSRPLLQNQQLYFASLYPELAPLVIETHPFPEGELTPPQQQDVTLQSYRFPDAFLIARSRFGTGLENPFWLDGIDLNLLGDRLQALNLYRGLNFNHLLVRRADGRDRPADLQVRVTMMPFDSAGNHTALTPEQIAEIAHLLDELLRPFAEFRHHSIQLRPENIARLSPGEAAHQRPTYRLDLEGGDNALRMQLMLILSELSIYQNGRWED